MPQGKCSRNGCWGECFSGNFFNNNNNNNNNNDDDDDDDDDDDHIDNYDYYYYYSYCFQCSYQYTLHSDHIIYHHFCSMIHGDQWWCSGESTHLPPMWPGFDSQTWHHMICGFVGWVCWLSLRHSERLFAWVLWFSPLLKTYILFHLSSFQFTPSMISASVLENLTLK